MPLTLVRSDSNANLWKACVGRFLDELGDARGGTEHGSHLWVTHRTQRNLLLEAAEERKIPGWLSPPFSFFSELPHRFGIELRPLGHLAGRLLLSSIANNFCRKHAFSEIEGLRHSHLIDRTLSELLPEGVDPNELKIALDQLNGDEFTARRNCWLTDTYRDYLEQLSDQGKFDPRSVHSLVADRIQSGGLPAALNGATRLHIYGLTSVGSRGRLFKALSAQNDVEVFAYVQNDIAPGEWERISDGIEDLHEKDAAPNLIIQPLFDGVREANWVARSVKVLLLDENVQPHKIAVVARTGREDTRRIRDALHRAGVPSTVRIRSKLSEIPALRAVLGLFEAVGEDWSWPTLKLILTSRYFEVPTNLRALEHIASHSRPNGLSDWLEKLDRLQKELHSPESWKLKRAGVRVANVEQGVTILKRFMKATSELSHPRSLSDWIQSTRQLIRGHPLGIRARVCEPVGDRWDVVRLDQRGTLALEQFLREWSNLLTESDADPIDAGAWFVKLKNVLDSNEIALSTPLQHGVQVLEAHEAAMTPFEHVFIVHANDRVFPRSQVGGLFTEIEREQLSQLGIPLATRELRLERERRLWRGCSGSQRVVVTYWEADSDGNLNLPSVFLPLHEREGSLPRTRLSSEEVPVTHAELLEREVRRFKKLRRGKDSSPFKTPDPHAIRHATLSAFAEELRTGELDPFTETTSTTQAAESIANEPDSLDEIKRPLSQRATAWNGLIRDPATLDLIREKYWENKEWSAAQLETYATRPFDFLVKYVLNLSSDEMTTDDLSPLNKGDLAHQVLEDFYRDFDPAFSKEQVRDQLDEIFNTVCNRYEADELKWVGLPYVWAVRRSELRTQLQDFVDWEIKKKWDTGSVLEVELRFGWKKPFETVDLSGIDHHGIQRQLRLGGRIDRVDRFNTDEGEHLRVVDYKLSSYPRPGEYKDAASLQCPLYMAAVERLGLGTVAEGMYRSIKKKMDGAKLGREDIEPALELAREIPDRIRAGFFEAVQAQSKKQTNWQFGLDITRTTARISIGTRFDSVTAIRLHGSLGLQEDNPESRMPE